MRLLFENSDIIANYDDDNTPYAGSSDLYSVIFKIQKKTQKEFSNAENSHLLVSSKENLDIQVSSCSIRNEDSVKLLGIHINNNWSFEYHVSQSCKKRSKKLYTLARIVKYMGINKRRRLLWA